MSTRHALLFAAVLLTLLSGCAAPFGEPMWWHPQYYFGPTRQVLRHESIPTLGPCHCDHCQAAAAHESHSDHADHSDHDHAEHADEIGHAAALAE